MTGYIKGHFLIRQGLYQKVCMYTHILYFDLESPLVKLKQPHVI